MDRGVLVDFAGEQHWPPPAAALGVSYVESTQFPSHIRGVSSFVGPGWETPELQEHFKQLGDKERARIAANYSQMEEAQAERLDREQRERFAQRANGHDT
jgi:hypothetical protein